MLRCSCHRFRQINQSASQIKQSIRQLSTKNDKPVEDLFTRLVGAPKSSVVKNSRYEVEQSAHQPIGQAQDKLNFDRVKQRLADIENAKDQSNDQSNIQSNNQSIDQSNNQSANQLLKNHQSSNQNHQYPATKQSNQSFDDQSLTNHPANPANQPKSRIGVPEIIEDPVEIDLNTKNEQLIDRMKRLMVGSSADHEFLNPAVNQSINQSTNQSIDTSNNHRFMQKDSTSQQNIDQNTTYATRSSTDQSNLSQTEIQSINQSTTPPQLKTRYKPSVRTAQVEEMTVKKGSLTQLQMVRLLAMSQTINQSTNRKYDSQYLSQQFHVDQHLIDRLIDYVAVPRLFVPDRSVNQPDQTGRIGVWPHRSVNQSIKHEPPPVYAGGRIMGEHLIQHLTQRL